MENKTLSKLILVPRDLKVSQEISGDLKRSQRISRDLKGSEEISWNPKYTIKMSNAQIMNVCKNIKSANLAHLLGLILGEFSCVDMFFPEVIIAAQQYLGEVPMIGSVCNALVIIIHICK